MKRLLSASAVCALAVGLIVVPGAIGKTSTKHVGGTVSVNVTPTTVATNPTPPPTTIPDTLTVTGNVASNSGCRKARTVHFSYSGAPLTFVGSPVTTGPNGDYTASIPAPTTTGQTVLATVDQVNRKFAAKRKGKKAKRGRIVFDCMQITGSSSTSITVLPAV